MEMGKREEKEEKEKEEGNESGILYRGNDDIDGSSGVYRE